MIGGLIGGIIIAVAGIMIYEKKTGKCITNGCDKCSK